MAIIKHLLLPVKIFKQREITQERLIFCTDIKNILSGTYGKMIEVLNLYIYIKVGSKKALLWIF